MGEHPQTHLVELGERDLQPALDARVWFACRRLFQFQLDVVGVVDDQDRRADQLERVVGARLHGTQREYHRETVDCGHVCTSHWAGDETPDAVAGQVAALESVHPTERVGGRVVAVGVGRGDLAAAGPEGVVQVVACVFGYPVAAFVELVGVREEGPGSECGLAGVPVDFLVEPVVIPDQVPERTDQTTRLSVPRRVRRHVRPILARVHERLKHLVLADEDRAPREVFGAVRAEVTAGVIDVVFVHRHPDAGPRI